MRTRLDDLGPSASVALQPQAPSQVMAAPIQAIYVGGSGDDTYAGTAASDTISGHDGNDTLSGAGGTDWIYGGSGNDVIIESDGGYLHGDAGNDTITGGTGFDLIYGDTGNDSLMGGAGNDALYGESSTTNGADTLLGEDGDDALISRGGIDSIDGGAGTDRLDFYRANATVAFLIDGQQTATSGGVTLADGTFVRNVERVGDISTGSGNDTIIATGSGGARSVATGEGNDLIDFRAGTGEAKGGAGDDTYYFSIGGGRAAEASGEGTDTIYTPNSYDLTGQHVEFVVLTGSAYRNLTGNSLDNHLTGNSGGNRIDGMAGTDTMVGLQGDDTYVVNTRLDMVIEAVNGGGDVIEASTSFTLPDQVEGLYLTGTANINGTGNAATNYISGNAGLNRLTGGLGDDHYVVQNTGDVVVEKSGEGIDEVYSSVDYTLTGFVEHLYLTDSAVNGTGSSVKNTIHGTASNNRLDGAGGDDNLVGMIGNDTYVVNNSGDRVYENLNEGTDLVESSTHWTLGNNLENLLLTGASSLKGFGNTLNNVITGNVGKNRLEGLDGNDTLNGGAGNDTLFGGLGGDLFLFQTGSGADRIDDYSAAQNDLIDVSSYTGGIADEGLISQVSTKVVIDLGGGNVITVLNALRADVLSDIIW